MTRFRRLFAVVAVSSAALGIVACGNHAEEEPGGIIRAETEGLYLDVSELKYQVQVSRQLNPDDPEDRGFLEGIPAAERTLGPDDVWFGVFLRVQNDTDETHRPATAIHIVDTTETEYEPIQLDPSNVFAYRPPRFLRSKALVPERDSPASETPIQGSLILFKLKNSSLENRPLELFIEGKDLPQKTGIVNLDV